MVGIRHCTNNISHIRQCWPVLSVGSGVALVCGFAENINRHVCAGLVNLIGSILDKALYGLDHRLVVFVVVVDEVGNRLHTVRETDIVEVYLIESEPLYRFFGKTYIKLPYSAVESARPVSLVVKERFTCCFLCDSNIRIVFYEICILENRYPAYSPQTFLMQASDGIFIE